MKSNFFFDEGEGRPYDSLKDWYREIRYLVRPAIIMVLLIAFVFLWITCNTLHSQ